MLQLNLKVLQLYSNYFWPATVIRRIQERRFAFDPSCQFADEMHPEDQKEPAGNGNREDKSSLLK